MNVVTLGVSLFVIYIIIMASRGTPDSIQRYKDNFKLMHIGSKWIQLPLFTGAYDNPWIRKPYCIIKGIRPGENGLPWIEFEWFNADNKSKGIFHVSIDRFFNVFQYKV